MNIRIENLSVNGLGPISSIQWQFKDVNLIYGKNEKGKTYLVEYLLRSLFKLAPRTRSLTDSGQVNITGLSTAAMHFTPQSKNKLEDYLFIGDEANTIDLSRLCVVKGGDLSFLPNDGKSISKDVLKGYLSDQRILDRILKKIPATIQESAWENGEIISKKQIGPLKNLAAEIRNLKGIDDLLNEVDEAYSLGEVKKLKRELESVKKAIEEQERARRANAYKLSKEIKSRENELNEIPLEDLDEIKSLQVQIDSKHNQIKQAQEEIANQEPKCQDYPWLKRAIEECKNLPEGLTGRTELVYVALAIIGSLVAITFAFTRIPIISLVGGLVAILFITLAYLKYRSKLHSSEEISEVNRIFQEFESKFGSKAHSIATLSSTFDELSPVYFGLQKTKDQIGGYRQELSELAQKLDGKLTALTGKKVKSDDFSELISSLQKKRSKLDEEFNVLKQALARMQVEPREYIIDPVETMYQPSLLEKLDLQRITLEESIREKESKMDSLKQQVCFITGDTISADWDDLIDHLRNSRDDVCSSTKELKASIGSGIVISQVINEIRAREDENISRALASPGLREPIKALTHTYDRVELEGNEIIACSDYQQYPLANLSTGAQEQVLLALRIGITSHVLKDQRMFLILDDAFQHSDWDRREWLVDEMAYLANIGWQIIYFSMDDHIKHLFDLRIKPKFQDRYQLFELNN